MGKGKSTTQRGYGWRWQQLRLEAFALYGTTCHICGVEGANTLDHLDPIAVHGTRLPDIDRVRPACRACNSRKGARISGPPKRKPPNVLNTSRQWF